MGVRGMQEVGDKAAVQKKKEGCIEKVKRILGRDLWPESNTALVFSTSNKDLSKAEASDGNQAHLKTSS